MILPAILAALGLIAVVALLFLAAATLYDYANHNRWRSTYDPEKETPPRGWKGQP